MTLQIGNRFSIGNIFSIIEKEGFERGWKKSKEIKLDEKSFLQDLKYLLRKKAITFNAKMEIWYALQMKYICFFVTQKQLTT